MEKAKKMYLDLIEDYIKTDLLSMEDDQEKEMILLQDS